MAGEHPEVVRVRAGLLAARAQREVAKLADAGKVDQALVTLNHSRVQLELGVSSGLDLRAELEMETVAELERRLRKGERQSASKFAKSKAYSKTTGRDDQTLKN